MRRQKVAESNGLNPVTLGVPSNGEISSDVAEKLRRLEVISELVEICNSTTNLNELMDKVFTTVVKDVGAEAGSLWLSDENTEENVCYVAEGPTKDKVLNLRLDKGVGVVGFVIDTGECQTVFDTQTDEKFNQTVDKKTGFQTRSMICAPLIVENKAIGSLQLLNKKTGDGKFHPADLSLLKLLCQASATPIVNARLRASEQKVQELSIMLDISKEITSTLDLDGCLLSVVNLCSKLIQYDRAAIGLVENEDMKISAISGQATIDGKDPDVINLKTLLSGIQKKGEDVYIASRKKYLKTESTESYIKEYLERYHQGSLAVYRLYDEESELGVFMMESNKENLISGSQTERIGILKNMLTVSLRNAQLYNSVPKLSVWDSWKKAKSVPIKKYLIVGSIIGLVIAALAYVKPMYKIGGKLEIKPQQKYQLYSQVDGEVESILISKEDDILKGDTLLAFKTEKLYHEITKQKNKLSILSQTIANLKLEGNYSELHVKNIEYQQALLSLNTTERKIKNSVITSPVNGYLLNNDIFNLKGRRFSLGDDLVEVVESSNKALQLNISEKEIRYVRLGQEVSFRVPAFPGKSFKGKVVQIAYETISEEDLTYYPIYVELNQTGETLLPGMTGWGKIEIEKRSLLFRLYQSFRNYLALKYWL